MEPYIFDCKVMGFDDSSAICFDSRAMEALNRHNSKYLEVKEP